MTVNPEAESARQGRGPEWMMAGWLGALLVLRLVSLWFNSLDLHYDEAQYWAWSRDPAFGYYSKPPLLGWLIGVSNLACGSTSEFCTRVASPIVHTITSVLIYFVAALLFDRRTGAWAAILFAPTLIGTIYGMNFTFMPELAWPHGYPLALLLMLVSALLPLWYFRRRGWL